MANRRRLTRYAQDDAVLFVLVGVVANQERPRRGVVVAVEDGAPIVREGRTGMKYKITDRARVALVRP